MLLGALLFFRIACPAAIAIKQASKLHLREIDRCCISISIASMQDVAKPCFSDEQCRAECRQPECPSSNSSECRKHNDSARCSLAHNVRIVKEKLRNVTITSSTVTDGSALDCSVNFIVYQLLKIRLQSLHESPDEKQYFRENSEIDVTPPACF